MTGERRKWRSEELHDLYCSRDTAWVIRSRRVRWEVHVARTRGKRRVYRCLVGKAEGKVPHRGRRPTCEGNIEIDRNMSHRRAWDGFVWLRAGKSDIRFGQLSVLPPATPYFPADDWFLLVPGQG